MFFGNKQKSTQKRPSRMSEEPRDILPRGTSLGKTSHKGFSEQGLGLMNQNTEVFNLKIDTFVDESTPEVMWIYNIPVLSPNQRQILLDMDSASHIIVATPTDNFPKQINVTCQELGGYLDKAGVSSHVIAILKVKQVIPFEHDGLAHFSVMYQLNSSTVWSLGTGRLVTFGVTDENGVPLSLPLANSLYLTLKLMHIAY